MNLKLYYQYCVVPSCESNTKRTPDKLFIPVPRDSESRKLWLKLARKEYNQLPLKTTMYFCEDHFDLPNDMENYMQFRIKGSVKKIRMKKGCLPSRFTYQPGRKRMSPSAECAVYKKKQRKQIVEETVKEGKRKKLNSATRTGTSNKKQVLKKSDPVLSEIVHKEETDEEPAEKANLRDRSVRLRNRKAYLANRKCSVPQCNNRPSKDISLHPCPNNAGVRTEWAEALRVSYQYIKNMAACSVHFSKTDFMQSKHAGEKVLKQNAVPSRNLPNRKRVVGPVKNKPPKKPMLCKDFERQKTMTDNDTSKEVVQESKTRECRACLIKLDDKKSCCNVFQPWAPPWDGMEPTIAEDLAKLANVEISINDRHSKVICPSCYQKLLNAATFASSVRSCDLILRQRFTAEIDIDKVWPKPIQVDKNIDGSVFHNPMDVEIKQEVVSDEEYVENGTENPYVETELANLDIKIEPEEFVEPPPMNITINGTISLDPLNSENKDLTNGIEEYQDDKYLEPKIKQEPLSDEDQEIEQAPDLPLECLLCTKSFNSVTGLKAHVIAQHSYKSVKRKTHGSLSPERKRSDKYHCAICRRSFLTSTDLMVHETCHNKHACYGCNEKFDSFDLLTRHRKRCKASKANSAQKLKTLDDVKRPIPEDKEEYLDIEIESVVSVSKTNNGDVEMAEAQSDNRDVEQKMKELFSENDATENIIQESYKPKGESKKLNNLECEFESETNDLENFTNDISHSKELLEKDGDNNMKIHLEILTNKTDTTGISNAELQLGNDECT